MRNPFSRLSDTAVGFFAIGVRAMASLINATADRVDPPGLAPDQSGAERKRN